MPKKISSPLTEKEARSLNVGEQVLISGLIFTARDKVHLNLLQTGKSPVNMNNHIVFHCGPIIKETVSGYQVLAAAPTTSSRMNKYEPKFIRKFKIRGIIGKGGMDKNVSKALKDKGAVYMSVVGGTAAVLAKTIKKVEAVYKLNEFGTPDAIWALRVENFPAIVTMDSKGVSLHRQVERGSKEQLKKLLSA